MKNKFNDITRLFLVALCILSTSSCGTSHQKITFAIASDFHAQDIPDGKERVETFVQTAQNEKVDFMIKLGDFCRLDSASQHFRDTWNRFPREKYHVIGNHDMDKYTAEEYVAGTHMPGRYYSFDKGNFHFIVLDGNNLYDGETHTRYTRENLYIPLSS